MGILAWIVFGLIAGFLAKFITPGNEAGGFIKTTLLGVGGAVVGGLIGTMLGFGKVSGFNLPSMVIAVGGAIVVLMGYRFIKGGRGHAS